MSESPKDRHNQLVAQFGAYNRMILTLGYGGLITVWITFRDDMSPLFFYSAGLLWMLSLAVFIAFEVWKMITTTRLLVRCQKILKEPPELRGVAYEKEMSAHSEWQVTWWTRALWLMVLSAILAFGIVFFSAAIALFSPADKTDDEPDEPPKATVPAEKPDK